MREIKGYIIITTQNVVFNEYDLPYLKTGKNVEPISQTENEDRSIEIERVGDINKMMFRLKMKMLILKVMEFLLMNLILIWKQINI